MTEQYIVVIACDGWGDLKGRCLEAVESRPKRGTGATDIRAAARKRGWTEEVHRYGSHDYCSTCTASRHAEAMVNVKEVVFQDGTVAPMTGPELPKETPKNRIRQIRHKDGTVWNPLAAEGMFQAG